MTVSTSPSFVIYAGAGTAGPFSVPFRFLANADLVITKTSALGVVSILTGNTITGADDDDGGEVYTAAPVAAGETLEISRATVRAQTAQYVANGPFPAATHERALDKAMLVDQEQDRDMARSLVVPLGEVGATLPTAADRASKYAMYDALGRPTAGNDVVPVSLLGFTALGAGSVLRDTQTKLREHVGPSEYGADGTADTASFVAAQAANLAIHVAAFTYDMNAPFNVAAGKTLLMDPGAVIAGASRFSTDLLPGGSIEMHTGGAANQTRSSIKRHTGSLIPGQGAFWSWDAGWERFMVSDDRDVGAGFNNHTWDRSQFGGAAMKGGRHARLLAAYFTAASHPDNNNRNYVADGAFFYVQDGDNGTGLTAGLARGAFFPRSDALFVEAAAQNLLHVTSIEANLFIAAGATMAYSAGRTVALNCQARGALIDCFHLITGQSANGAYTGHIGSNAGYVQSNSSGADPFHAGSKVFTQYWTGGGTKPVATVFDVSGYAATKVIEGRQLTLTEGLLALDAGAAGAEVRAASAGANGTMIIRSKGASAVQMRSEADAVIASFSPNSTANVNFVQFFPNFTNIGPIIRATGGDANVNLRLETKGAGVIEAISPLRLPSFTVGGVPSASVSGAGAEIFVTNESGGAVTAFSDATNWRRVTDRAVIS